MKIHNFHFLFLAIAFLCDPSFSNTPEETDYKKNVRHKLKQEPLGKELKTHNMDDSGKPAKNPTLKQRRSGGLPMLTVSTQPSQSNFVQTSWSTSSLGGNSSLSPQIMSLLNDPSFQNSVSTMSQVKTQQFKFPVQSQVSWSVSVNNASGSLPNIINAQIPIQNGISQNETIQKLIQNFMLNNNGNGANPQPPQGSWVVLMNSTNISPTQTEYKVNYTIHTINVPVTEYINITTIRVSVPILTLTTQISTEIGQIIVPYLNKYLSPIKSEVTGTRQDIVTVLLPKLKRLESNLSNLISQLNLSGTSSSQQVLIAFALQLSNVLTGLRSSVKNLKNVAQKTTSGSNPLPETLLQSLSNIQQNIKLLQPVLQVITLPQGPSLQIVNGEENLGPLQPTIQVSVATSTLTTQITTVIQQTLVPYLQKYLSPLKSEMTGTRTEILIVLLPKLQQLITDLSNLKNQLSISSTSNSQQVLTVFLLQLTTVITELQSSVNNLQIAAQKADNGSKELPETLLKPLSNIQQSLNQLHPVLQVIKPSQGPTPQVIDGKENSGPSHPNLNVDGNGSVPALHEVPSTTKEGSGPLNPNLNVDGSRKSSSTPKTNPVDELSRLVDHIPVIASRSDSLNDAVVTAQNLESQLSDIHNLTLNGSAGKSKDQEKDIQRAILRVTHSMAILQKGPLQASSDLPKYSNVSVLTFSIHSTQIVLSLITVFKFYFGDNFPTIEFDGQTLNTATVELLSNTATNLQLLLPYVQDLSGKNDGKILESYQNDVDHSINNVFKSLRVLMPYLRTVTSELSSGTPQSNQPKDLLLTVTNLIVNFELTYPFYANILGNRAKQLPQLVKKNRDLYIVALSISAQLHNVSLATTEFHQTVWTNIVPQFTKFVSVIVSFDLTSLKGSPKSTDLLANLELLLPYVQKISETKSSPAGVALQATFALIRPQLEQLSQTINAKTMQSTFSSITFTKDSTAFLVQFSNMFKSLNLLLTHLDVNNSTKSASADFVLYTIADFKFWVIQSQQVVLDALKNVEATRKSSPTPETDAVDKLNQLINHIPVIASLNDAVTTAQKLDFQLSYLRNVTLTGNVDQPKNQDLQRAILNVAHNMAGLKKSPLQASSYLPKYSNVSVQCTFLIHSTNIVLTLANLFKFYFGVNFGTINFDGQALNVATIELLSNTATNLQLLLPYVRDLSRKNGGKLLIVYQGDVDHAMNNVFSSLTVLMPYLVTVTTELSSNAPHLDQPKDLLLTVTQVIVNFELTYPYYANILRNRAKQLPQLTKTNRDLHLVALSFSTQLHNVSLAATEFHQIVWTNIVPQFAKFVSVIVSFDLTLLKGSPGSTDLSANLQLLLPYVQKISETKSSSASVALNAIFALIRPQLEQLLQTLNAKSMRISFSSITFTKDSTVFLVQFSNMFKSLDLLLTYLNVNASKKSASADFFPFTIADFKLWFSQAHQVVLDALKNVSSKEESGPLQPNPSVQDNCKNNTPVKNAVNELNRLVDYIPGIKPRRSSLDDALTTAKNLDSQLDYLRNLTLTGNEDKLKECGKDVARAMLRVTHNLALLRQSPLKASLVWSNYWGEGVANFPVHSTRIVLSLAHLFTFFFGVNFPTTKFDGQALSTATVELLSNTATDLRLLLPIVRTLSSRHYGRIYTHNRNEMDQAIDHIFSSLPVLMPYLRTVSSELTSGPKDFLPTVTQVIADFELTYPYYANVLYEPQEQSPQIFKRKRDLYIVALSLLCQLHNLSLAATEFHQNVWTNIVPNFSNFVHDVLSFDLTLLKDSPELNNLLTELELLLHDVRKISETKSSSAVMALNAIFALLRPELSRLTQTLNATAMRASYSSVTFTPESTVFFTQFSKVFKSLDLLLSYLEVVASKKFTSVDFLLITIADFRFWFSQAHKLVLDELKLSVEASVKMPLDKLNELVDHIPFIASLSDGVTTAQNMSLQLSYLCNATLAGNADKHKDREKDIQRVILKVTHNMTSLRKSALQASSDLPKSSNASVLTFSVHSTQMVLSLVNLFKFYFGADFPTGNFERQPIDVAVVELFTSTATDLQLLLPYARDLSQKSNGTILVPYQDDVDQAVDNVFSTLTVLLPYLRNFPSDLHSGYTHPERQGLLLAVNNVTENFELMYPYYANILQNRAEQTPQLLKKNQDLYFVALSLLGQLHNVSLSSAEFHQIVWTNLMIVPKFSDFVHDVIMSFNFTVPERLPKSANLQLLLPYVREISETKSSSAVIALDAIFALLRPQLERLSHTLNATTIRTSLSLITSTKQSTVFLTQFSNLFKNLDLLFTYLDVSVSKKSASADFFLFTIADFKLWLFQMHQVVLDAQIKELNRLVDHIPVVASLNDAVTTAQNLDSQLSLHRNLTVTGNADKHEDHRNNILRVILKMTLSIALLQKSPLQASSDLPKYSDFSVLKFSVHSTQVVLSLVNLFRFYFGVSFATSKFDGQALNVATVELLSNTATNLQLLLPYARDLSGKNNGKALVSDQDDVDHSINNVFSTLTVLVPYLRSVTSELSSNAPHSDQPKDLLLTVTQVIVNLELTYPYYANIVRNRAEQHFLNKNQDFYVLALSFLAQLHNVSLAATEFHQTVWTNIAPKFSNFVHDVISFNLALLKGPANSNDLSANLTLLLPYVRKISETKSSSASVALNATFALLRPQLEHLSQTINAKTLRSSFSSINFTKDSTGFLTQFSNMFKNLDLLLVYLDVNNSTKSASADFLPFTIADFKLWFFQAHLVVSDALKNLPVEDIKTSSQSPVEVVKPTLPTRKPPRNHGWISLRRLPNLETSSAEKVSS